MEPQDPADAAHHWRERWDAISGSTVEGGGQGDVKLVRRAGRTDATTHFLKILRHQNDAGRRRRMYREVSAYRTLQSGSVPHLVDTNVEHYEDLGYKLYLVTEYVPGPTLAQHVAESGPLPHEAALGLVSALLAVVGDCHGSDVVHRDIKPDNIILRGRATDDPVLVDFGLSFDENLQEDTATHASEEVGNRFLRLPELSASSPSKRDPRSDVTFCAGVLLHALTGHAPALLWSERRQMPHQRDDVRRALDAMVPRDALPRVLRMFDRAFETDLVRRWQSAAELRAAVDELRTPEPPPADTAEEIWTRVERFMTEPRVRATADAARSLEQALTQFRAAHVRVAKRVEAQFTASQTGHRVDRADGIAETLLTVTRADAPQPAPWVTCRAAVVGDEMVLSMSVGGTTRIVGRTSVAQPTFDLEFQAAAERVFLDLLATQLG